MTELQSVTLKRHFAISAERLFELLSTPEHMQQWFHPSPEIRMELDQQAFEVGGRYKFYYHIPNGEIHTVVGEYCAIEPPTLIAFTWGWEEPDENAGINTLVTLSLDEKDGRTELTVLHEQLHAGDMLDRHEAGWLGTLDLLEQCVNTLLRLIVSEDRDELLARIRLMTAGDSLTEQRQFGGNSFMLRGNMLCCVGKHGMMARVGKEQETIALAKTIRKPFDMTGRRMGGMINVAPEGLAADEDLLGWLNMARSYVETLPTKVKKPKSPTKAKRKTP